MDAMHGMLKQEGGVNKANLMGSEPKLTSSAPLEKGEDSDEPVWLVSTRALSAGSCFIDRPYCAASPQASHRARPALGLATKELYTKTCALSPRSQERSLTAHLANANTGIMLLPARFGLLSCREAGGEFRDRTSLQWLRTYRNIIRRLAGCLIAVPERRTGTVIA